jgi:signal recognition particle subunit SRP54
VFENLSRRFTQVLGAFGIKKRLTEANIEDSLREIRTALIEADAALPVIKSFIARVKEKALGAELLSSVEPGQQFVKILHDELVALLGGEQVVELKLPDPSRTASLLVCGLQGSGKTTTCGKLARHLKDRRDILLVSLDVNRPAAAEQLRILAGQAGVDFYDRGDEKDPAAIVRGARKHAERHVRNLIVYDTAGRTQVDAEMLSELGRIHKDIKPDETLFVADAMTGQRALAIAKAFRETVPISAVIFTKFDSDTRGGAVLSVKETLGVPIPYVGTGESIEGFEAFNPRRVADRMLGMGDIVGLVEKAQSVVDEKQAMALAEKIKKNTFDLDDFLAQLSQIDKMGGVQSMMEMLPGMGEHSQAAAAEVPRLRRMRAILQSMTGVERQKPFMINNSRRLRIAKGSGTTVLDVNQLLKRFDDMRGMMRKMKNPAQMKRMLSQLGVNADDPASLARLERLSKTS